MKQDPINLFVSRTDPAKWPREVFLDMMELTEHPKFKEGQHGQRPKSVGRTGINS